MRGLLWIIVVLIILTLVGTGWFWLVEGWSLLDSVYMTIITLSTVGYSETHPLTDRSRIFIMIFLVCGLGVFLFSVVQIGEMVVRAEIGDWLRRRGMNSTLKSMNNHLIVCGFGRMGQTICQRLDDRGLSFVVVDSNEAVLAECERRAWPCVCDDATSDQTLLDAGIDRARGMAVVLDSDADNLYVVMSSRLLAPQIQIIVRAADETSSRKMRKAGANRVVSVYKTAATTMAQLMINPHVEDFFEIVSGAGTSLDLAEIRINPESPYCDKKLSETDFRERNVIIVALRRPDGELLLPPPADAMIQANDSLIAMGKVSAVSQFLSDEK